MIPAKTLAARIVAKKYPHNGTYPFTREELGRLVRAIQKDAQTQPAPAGRPARPASARAGREAQTVEGAPRTRAAARQTASRPHLVVIELDTRSFDFRACGRTVKEAREALRHGWAKHVAETGAEPDHINWRTDGNVFIYAAGECWRDDHVLVRVPATTEQKGHDR